MADVRAMLRAERAARTQPPARKPAKTAAPPTSKNLKRKAADSDDDDAWDTTTTTTTTAKRARGSDGGALPEDFFDPGAKPSPESRSIESTQFTSRPASHDAITTTAQPTNPTALPSSAVDTQSQPPSGPDATTTVDEDEWAAFEREVAAAPAPQQPSSTLAAINAAATIEAKPMTAEELAAQAKDELNKQRSRREEEMDAEKEDAVRHLEEEFDEMEELEQRVQRLRAQREALRQTGGEHAAVAEEAPSKAAEDEEDEDESEDEDDDDFDDWRFRGP